MGWRDRLRTALATEAAGSDTAECAPVKTANNAKTPPKDGEGEVSAQLAVLAEGYFPEKAAAAPTQAPAVPSPPADAPALLRHLRDVLYCRVTLEGDQLAIWPPHRCPPDVLAAALAVVGELRSILDAEATDFLDAVLGAGGDGEAIPLDLPAGRVLPAGPPGAVACSPTDAQVKALAMTHPAPAGLVRRNGAIFEHYCTVCGAWGAWGYGPPAAATETWFCGTHRPQDEGQARRC